MAGGLHKYTVIESGNTQLGQGGSVFIDDTSAATFNGIVVAITMVEDTTFTLLTSETAKDGSTKYYANTAAVSAAAAGNTNAIDSSNIFPAGMTIFGRWTAVTLDGGSVIAYIG